jgi:hypothetical protein
MIKALIAAAPFFSRREVAVAVSIELPSFRHRSALVPPLCPLPNLRAAQRPPQKPSELPSDEEEFSHPESAFALVQQYAFANGFAAVQTQKEKPRRVFSCVHYGKAPNKRKITSDAVSKEYFMEMGGVDTTGNKLRQRQGMVSRATRRDRRERGSRSVTDSKKRLGRQNVVGL